MNNLLPCPFCGQEVEEDDIYPTGTGWKAIDECGRSYHSFRDVPKEQWCYAIHCEVTRGGCGARISGDSQEEAIAAWNKRKAN